MVTAAIWRFLFNPQFGGLNATLRVLYGATGGLLGSAQGLPWTGEPSTAMLSLTMVNAWKGVPFFTLLALAGLKSIDRELYEAASIDGANAWQPFLNVTLPGLRYVIIVETLFSVFSTFNIFGLVYLITGGGPGGASRLYALRTYELIGSLRYGHAMAVALLVAPILLVAVVILGQQMRAGQRGVSERGSLLYRAVMALLLPLRLVVRVLLAALWSVNGLLERAAGWLAGDFYALVAGQDLGRRRAITRGFMRVLVVVPLVVITFAELYPFYWIVNMAFKTDLQIQQFGSIFWPDPWTLEHFQWLFTESSFPLWLRSSSVLPRCGPPWASWKTA